MHVRRCKPSWKTGGAKSKGFHLYHLSFHLQRTRHQVKQTIPKVTVNLRREGKNKQHQTNLLQELSGRVEM